MADITIHQIEADVFFDGPLPINLERVNWSELAADRNPWDVDDEGDGYIKVTYRINAEDVQDVAVDDDDVIDYCADLLSDMGMDHSLCSLEKTVEQLGSGGYHVSALKPQAARYVWADGTTHEVAPRIEWIEEFLYKQTTDRIERLIAEGCDDGTSHWFGQTCECTCDFCAFGLCRLVTDSSSMPGGRVKWVPIDVPEEEVTG